MDKRIFLSLIGIILLIGAMIAIRAYVLDTCVPPEFTVEPEYPTTADSVIFKCSNCEDEDVSWDFGDGVKNSGVEVHHKYEGARGYTVTASMNAKCMSLPKEIKVREMRKHSIVTPTINLPSDTIFVGSNVQFADATVEATEWNWTLTPGDTKGTDRIFSTRFVKPDHYQLRLSIKGTYISGDTVIEVNVIARPKPKPLPAPPPPPVIRERKPAPPPVVHEKPIPKPKPIAPPPPAPKPAPVKAVAFNVEEFNSDFKDVASRMNGSEGSRATNDWVDKVMKKVCDDAVVTIKDTKGISTVEIEDFETQLILKKFSSIVGVSAEPKNLGKGTCVSKIIVTVITN